MIATQRILLVLWFLSSALSFCEEPHPVGPSPQEQRNIRSHNQAHQREISPPAFPIQRPFAEYEQVKYLVMGGKFYFQSQPVKTEIAKNIPSDVTLIVGTNSEEEATSLRAYYNQFVDERRLSVFAVPKGIGFWVRDSLPFPVYRADTSRLALVDARYFKFVEPDLEIAKQLGVDLVRHNLYFEGGNLISDTTGNCITVEKPGESIPQIIFQSFYGCSSVLRLPFTRGVGHVDERIKLLSDKVALTDEPSYLPELEKHRFTTHLLPKLEEYETYANALLVNHTAFVPIYGHATDQDALTLYEANGYRAIGMRVDSLAHYGQGALHCLTMTYP
ncbi:MAG: agmatine deiminase family protein [Deltaproteobacteria bacterium]|nr:agmatine deiminase family protein [Deltaproteobacteria bacterium]